jgi:lycopene cyclase domain-containing protein
MQMSNYAFLLLFSVAVPLFLSFWPPLKFYRNLKALILTILMIVVIFGAWDVFATYKGHWYFNPKGVWNLKILNLPIEEWLFFIVIPFCCIFTWEALKYIRGRIK